MNDTEILFPQVENATTITIENPFLKDVIIGLTSHEKHLSSKYFYDEAGDALFQQIMQSHEYYPTRCEMEIFVGQHIALAAAMRAQQGNFDLVELGAGDAVKTHFLLKYLLEQETEFIYKPIDISENMITYLETKLPAMLPGLRMEGLKGDYIPMLKKVKLASNRRKIVLFLGSSIGNMSMPEAAEFCAQIRKTLAEGDMLLIGADLRKDPRIILAAYNDECGLTKQFNLNLLSRINRELGANFDTRQFEHFPTYDPKTGACKSYLISISEQVVKIGAHVITFQKDEVIDMEISQKYTLEDIRSLAAAAGFKPVADFYDRKQWFLDTLWVAV